ncbi:IS4 family transposase [Planomonospora sp. ID82291]|uniref:IS4 family transposase n=1 Tax=Planomonospora sp. ID82291 TaxID=2738136 RepID=UPI0018C37A34|nr:IS4 family transposase [Planomonospora sp. ID82291]MBG0818174.1 IS4 family transposase [Planomonospora sp. ID82291]
MSRQSATITVTHAITTADGIYAPGHLGELTQQIPFELVDAVLADSKATQRRLRDLPSRVGVYFVLALTLFPRLGYVRVWGKLVAGLHGLALPTPSDKALRDLRRRVGAAPIKALFDVLAGPIAQPHTPGARYRRWRTVAFDGCSSLKVPDTTRNRDHYGRACYRQAWAGYPMLMLMTLVETGTRALIGAAFGAPADGENAYALRLLAHLRSDMLVLADRAFDADAFLRQVTATGAHLLVRIRASRRPPVMAALPDGSFLSILAGVKVRIIDADVVATLADGRRLQGRYRLVTTLTDHRTDPAGQLMRLYHERWEIESAYLALRHTLLTGAVLRSGDPAGVEQEMWAALTLYQALRRVMTEAVESRPGTDPDRACFTTALERAREQLITACRVLPETDRIDLLGEIGRAVLADLLPARRRRLSIRKVKSPISRYHTHRADDRPPGSVTITDLHIRIHPGRTAPPVTQPGPLRSWALDRHLADTTRPVPVTRRSKPTVSARISRKQHALALMRAQPGRSWHAREIGQFLDVPDLHSFCVQMAQWARQGLVRKIGHGIYALP